MNELEKLQAEIAKRKILSQILTKEAFERLGRVKLANPLLAEQVSLYLIQLYQAGKLKTHISDEQLKLILEKLSSGKKFKIIRK